MSTQRFCTSCGSALGDRARSFCTSCGAPLVAASRTATHAVGELSPGDGLQDAAVADSSLAPSSVVAAPGPVLPAARSAADPETTWRDLTVPGDGESETSPLGWRPAADPPLASTPTPAVGTVADEATATQQLPLAIPRQPRPSSSVVPTQPPPPAGGYGGAADRASGQRRAGGYGRIVGFAVGVVLVAAGAGVGAFLLARPHPTRPAATDRRATAAPSASASPAPAQSASASVSPAAPAPDGTAVLSPGASAFPDASAVASTFTAYFSDINRHDYASAFALFTPDEQAAISNEQTWASAEATSHLSRVTVTNIASSGSDLSATVAFRSTQQAYDAPDRVHTCTDWQLTYQLAPESSYPVPYGIAKVTPVNGAGWVACAG